MSMLFVLDSVNNNYLPAYAVQQVLMTFSMVLFFAAALFPLIIGAAAICVEKQRESYDLLATTLLRPIHIVVAKWVNAVGRSEEHTSELQSLMRISYAVFCL